MGLHKFTVEVRNRSGDVWEKDYYHHNDKEEEVRRVHLAMNLDVLSCRLEEKVY